MKGKYKRKRERKLQRMNLERVKPAADAVAWLKIQGKQTTEQLDDIANSPFAIPFVLQNVGNTPTGQITLDAVIEMPDRDRPPSFNYSVFHGTTTTGTLFPKDTSDIKIALYRKDHSVANLTSEEVQVLKEGAKYIAIFGVVRYSDSFGPHWTTFCFWKNFGPEGVHTAAGSCTDYNQVDILKN